jgi:O-glycosyl hydrolase
MKRQAITTLAVALALTTTAATRTANITINNTTKYQYIDGFGGTAMNSQWGDTYTQKKAEILWGQGDGQVGLNIMRLRINPNENNWGEYGKTVKWGRAVCPSLQVFATPWTPPKKWKTHNTTKYQNDFGTWVWPLVEHSWGGEGSNGGAFNPEHYGDYADFLERYRQKMEQNGSPIDMISIQNECDYTPTATDNGVEHASYESCIFSPKEMAAMVKAARQKVDPKCKIMGPETFGWGQHNYNTTLVGLQDAVDNIDIWGNHCYGTNDWSFVRTVTNKTKKHMWMTEFLIDYPSGYNGNFATEYQMIENIEQVLKAGYSAYVYYNMLTHFFASNHGGSDTQLWKRGYIFSHYAKNVTGKTRISNTVLSLSTLKGGSAYQSADGDTIVISVLNTSATDVVNLTVTLPFEPKHISQVVTSEAANAKRDDVTALYVKEGSKKPVVTLQPATFYTFVFTTNEPTAADINEPAQSYKKANQTNPLSEKFMADPTAIEYNGRLYVYATNDQQEYDVTLGLSANSYSKITQLTCLSTTDLVNWTDHGVIDVKAIAPWISTSWAPSIVSREESDGKTHFYLYFTNSANGIGVLTATSPTGPWTDPLGHALIDRNTAGLGTISQIIDPGVAISDDGTEAYLTFGGGDIKGTALQPGNARIVRLGSDMTSLQGDIKPISAPCHFEANELNYINGKWWYSYCTRWTIASDWSTFSKGAAPSAASMVYMVADDPLADEWSYRSEFMPNPGTLGYPAGNNHTHLQKFGSSYYLLYHTQWLEQQMGVSGGYRNLQISKIAVQPARQSITKLTSSTASVTGPSQLLDGVVNPYLWQDGRMAAIMTRNWQMVRGVDFSLDGGPAKSLLLRVKGSGTVEARLSTFTAAPVATATFSTADEQVLAVDLSEPLTKKADYLYFVSSTASDALPQVLGWAFSPLPAAEAVTDIDALQWKADSGALKVDSEEPYYNLRGQRVAVPTHGLYIRCGKKIVVRP